jgi:hypothetical protein
MDFKVDMTDAKLPYSNHTKRRKGTKRDRDQYWDERYLVFKNAGFTPKESRWAANKGLSLDNKWVQDILVHRQGMVDFFIRRGNSRAKSIELSAQVLDDKLGPDEKMNLFKEIS